MSDSWPRRRLLAILRGASDPLDAQELARVTGQHVTTVRFHLDVLTRESLVRQVQQPPRGRGRPRIGYSAVQRSVGYQDLAQVLADQIGSDPKRRHESSVTAGRAWGAKVDGHDEPIRNVPEARDAVVAAMSELGFAPEREPDGTDEQAAVRMTACPLRDLARTHSEVVCGVHLGLLRELVERHGDRGALAVDLQPFVKPEACLVRVALARQRRMDPTSVPGPDGPGPVLAHAELAGAERIRFSDPATVRPR